MSVVSRLAQMGFDVITRHEWGAKYEALYQRRRETKPSLVPARYSFGHITVTRNTSDFRADMRTLENIGFERFGTGISYTWCIDPDTGMIGEGHPLDAKGAHTVNKKNALGLPYDLNYWAHGIACIGMPGLRVSEKFQLSFAAILRAEYDENTTVDDAPLFPHSAVAYKDCPTSEIATKLPAIRRTAIAMGEIMPLEFSTPVPGAPLDPDGTQLKVGEALLRGNHAYWHGPVEGSITDRRLDNLESKTS